MDDGAGHDVSHAAGGVGLDGRDRREPQGAGFGGDARGAAAAGRGRGGGRVPRGTAGTARAATAGVSSRRPE